MVEASETGHWFGLPLLANVTIDPASGTLKALSTDGAAACAEIVIQADGFETALDQGLDQLATYLEAMSEHDTPDLLPEEAVDRALDYANSDVHQETHNSKSAFEFVIQANGPVFFARVIHRNGHPDDLSEADWMGYLMMRLASYDLNGFDKVGLLETLFEEQPEENAGNWPDTSALTLVRRVPLADVVADFMADQDFSWKSDLLYSTSKLPDPTDFAKLRLDIYEDRVTGATPKGLDLAWNPTNCTPPSMRRRSAQSAGATLREPITRRALSSRITWA